MTHIKKPSQIKTRLLLIASLVSLIGISTTGPFIATTYGNPLAGASFYIDSTQNNAAKQASIWRTSRPNDAAMMDIIARQPKAYWMGNWNANSQQAAADYVNRAQAQGKTGVIVSYNIPSRDCGSYSAGGAGSHAAYRLWVDGLAAGLGGRKTVIIVEPDALAQLDCLDLEGKQARLQSLNYAVAKLKGAGALTYIDIGNKGWLSSSEATNRLQQGGIAAADGFTVNVSNFYTTSESTIYGDDISNRLGGKKYIIDTSRNGLGSNGEWCNPTERALGRAPSSITGSTRIDAYLWIKGPGESDGICNGGPAAGTWWPEYALGLAMRSSIQPVSTRAAPTGATGPTATPSSTSPTATAPVTPLSAAVTAAPAATDKASEVSNGNGGNKVLGNSAAVAAKTNQKVTPVGIGLLGISLAIIIGSVVVYLARYHKKYLQPLLIRLKLSRSSKHHIAG